MKVFMACPAPPRSRKGNRVTALRWASILRSLGHRLRLGVGYDGRHADVMIALHARRSFEALRDYRKCLPNGPLIVALTGTDLFRDIRHSRRAQKSLEWADRLVVLQPRGLDELPARFRSKTRVIYQSTTPIPRRTVKDVRSFDVAVLGHLRYEKDPLRAALAARRLPAESRVRVIHAGEALSADWARRAQTAERRDPRYQWIGEVPRWKARRLLARSRLLVLSSRMEGGANVVSEAIVEGVPVLASHIPGNVGLLGAGYPGYFPVGDTQALADLLVRAENDAKYYERLQHWCDGLRALFEPAQERQSWEQVLEELRSCPSKRNAGTTL